MALELSRSPEDSRLSTVTLMTPELANFSGNVHGGHILRLVDEIAYACACNYSGKYCVTLSVDRMLFKHPVRVGELLSMHAQVNYTGRTSMQIGVRVEAKDLQRGVTRHTNSSFVTMVALEDGKPCPITPIVPRTEIDHFRWERAEMSRAHSRAVERVATQVGDFLTIVDLAAAPMLLIDKETGLVRLANRLAVELLGYPASELVSRPVWEIHGPDERENIRRVYAQVATENFSAPFTFNHIRPDGKSIEVEATSWVIPFPTRPLIQRVMRLI
ncbi:MAG TPA: hotdog domain-containing protein [Polyangiaceae bacterium]|jgi:PAS domain S-box-containing protein|nr:hotdog domain-containing protein [Polyangiaceae bacterium]